MASAAAAASSVAAGRPAAPLCTVCLLGVGVGVALGVRVGVGVGVGVGTYILPAVEVADVDVGGEGGYVRTRQGARLETGPVDGAEVRLRLQLVLG